MVSLVSSSISSMEWYNLALLLPTVHVLLLLVSTQAAAATCYCHCSRGGSAVGIVVVVVAAVAVSVAVSNTSGVSNLVYHLVTLHTLVRKTVM